MTMTKHIIILLLLLVIVHTLLNYAKAGGNHGGSHGHEHTHDDLIGPPGPPGVDGMDGVDGTCDCDYRILSDDDLDAIFAGAMAADAINFSFGTRKKQIGFGIGHYNGENAFALGVGWLVETEELEYLISLKAAMTERENDVGVGVGATALIGE